MRIKLMDPNAIVPSFANPGDAGVDLHAVQSHTFYGGEQKLIGTGIAFEIPEGYFGLVRPRSGLSSQGVGMNSSGVIDSGYRGEVKVNLWYTGSLMEYTISAGDRIAQILFLPVMSGFEFEVVEELSATVRGENGFGSSGGWAG